MSNSRPFTCYFCNRLIENETEMGHIAVCSKVLTPCPYKCGAYIQRASLVKHIQECINNVRKSTSQDKNAINPNQQSMTNTQSLDRKGIATTTTQKMQDEIGMLNRRFSELEARLRTLSFQNNNIQSRTENASLNKSIEDIKTVVQKQSQALQKSNYFNGYISEWKKNMEAQLLNLKSSMASVEGASKEYEKRWNIIQEKLAYLQHLQMDLNLLKETVYHDNTHFKKTEMDFARNIEELRGMTDEQNNRCDNMWRKHDQVLQNIIRDIHDTKQLIDEQKAKYAGLNFELRAVSQISSEAAERIEIQEREFGQVRHQVNQMKVDLEILEGLISSGDSNQGCFNRLLWRITEVESKIKRAKENDIVLKSPIFYTHRYGYKIRVLLYINGLKKWKDRYALACINVLKGEYDPLLTWPCLIEGNITLRDLNNINQPKNFSKFIKTKRASGDEEEDEPQESSSTYIFIPHNVLLKETYLKNDTVFLDITINNSVKIETSL